jgi:predicted O-linked N-acetylglucosamine transferase (SPINDLY family)
VTFAHKPAPVQATWIGYPATTGLKAVDYYLSDRLFTPLAQFAGQFTEKFAFLPAIAPFMPHPDSPLVSAPPALRNGFVTFGSFNRMNKIRPEVVALWARILRELPDSRMDVGAVANLEEISTLATAFRNEGIELSRIEFVLRASMSNYLQQHERVDVCLDAFPYAGSTTTLHALWMGVPTLTMPGNSPASRGSATWLSHVGLDAFLASDKDDYVGKSVALATDIDALAKLRTELRQRCMQSPAFNARTVAIGVSRALRIMWQRWCNGLEPEHFEVPPQTTTMVAHDVALGEIEGAS